MRTSNVRDIFEIRSTVDRPHPSADVDYIPALVPLKHNMWCLVHRLFAEGGCGTVDSCDTFLNSNEIIEHYNLIY